MPTLRTMTPKKGTPTAAYNGRGEKTEISGIVVWIKGASPTYDNNDLSPYNERAAYLVDKMLNLKFVPTTVLRLVKGRVVSAQRWVDADDIPKGYNPPLLRLFDFLISNTDRHGGNWLIGQGSKVWAIDNAYSFYEKASRYSTYGEGTAVQDLSEVEKAKLRRRLRLILAKPKEVHKQLDSLIGKVKTGALISRMKQVLKQCQKEGKRGK